MHGFPSARARGAHPALSGGAIRRRNARHASERRRDPRDLARSPTAPRPGMDGRPPPTRRREDPELVEARRGGPRPKLLEELHADPVASRLDGAGRRGAGRPSRSSASGGGRPAKRKRKYPSRGVRAPSRYDLERLNAPPAGRHGGCVSAGGRPIRPKRSDGFFVSDRAGAHLVSRGAATRGWHFLRLSMRRSARSPPRAAGWRPRISAATWPCRSEIAARLASPDGMKDPVFALGRILASTRVYQRAARELYDRERPDLMTVYFRRDGRDRPRRSPRTRRLALPAFPNTTRRGSATRPSCITRRSTRSWGSGCGARARGRRDPSRHIRSRLQVGRRTPLRAVLERMVDRRVLAPARRA